MTRALRALVVVAAFVGLAPAAHAQGYGTSIEMFGSFGGLAGVTPMHVLDRSRVGVHAGFRFDGGFQGEHLGLGVGARVWELAPTQDYGGHGIDGFLLGEWRAARDSRTTLRFTAGAGFDEVDPGRGADREHTGTQGFLWSFGVGQEFVVPSGALVLASADLVMPHVNGDIDGRRWPVLELGFAYRSRFFESITTLSHPR